MKVLKVFIASGCGPCEEVKRHLKAGRIALEGVPPEVKMEIVDVTTEDGFPAIAEYKIDGVPTVFMEGSKCSIGIDDEHQQAVILCNES